MIKNLKIHNFGKIEDLDIDCSNNRNVFILGQNGSGKTTILQAISLALTGKVAKGITNDAYIGPKDKDFLIVLELDDGTKIGRTCKGAKLKLPNGSVYKKVKDVYEHLSFDPALLYNLSYVRQGEIADIFLSGNGKAVVDKLISLIIDYKRISDGNTDLTRLSKQYEAELDSIDKEIEYNQNTINSIDYDSLINDYNRYKEELTKLTSMMQYSSYELDKFITRLDRYDYITSLLKNYKLKYDELKSRVDSLVKPKLTIKELRDKQNLCNEYSDNVVKLNILNDDIMLYEDSKQFAKDIDQYISIRLPKTSYTKSELDDIKHTKDNVFHYLTNTDNLTETDAINLMHKYHSQEDIDAGTILNIKKQLENYINILKPYEDVVRYVRSVNSDNALDAIETRINEMHDQVKDIIDKYKDIDIPEEEVTDEDFNKLQNEWSEYNSVISMYDNVKTDIGKLLSEYKALEKEILNYPSREDIVKIKDSNNTINHLNSMIDLCNKHFALYQEANIKIKSLKDKQCSIYKNLEQITHWKGIFNEIPNRLRQTLFNPVVSVLNKEFYELFSFNGLGEIKIDWSKVLITVGDKRFEQLSGAQMVAVGLSLRLALLKVMGECVPIMLVDEPTTFLDDDRKNDISKLLAHMGSVSQCFVSTHDDNIIGSNSVIVNLNK